jgi:pyridoxine 4-dehydrogenase
MNILQRCLLLSCYAFSANALVSWPSKNSQQLNKVGRVSAGPIDISGMGVGTWSWGNRLLFDYSPDQDEDIYEAYRAVRDAGVSIFDTADSYGTLDLNGRAEILLGRFERRYLDEKMADSNESNKQNQQNFFSAFVNNQANEKKMPPSQQVATKLAPYPWRITPSSMVNAVEASLKRLEQDKLTLAQLHWSTANYQPFQEKALWEGIGDVYDKGLCEAVGVSNYGPIQFQKISQYMRDRSVPLATAQIQYSLMTYQDAKDMNAVCDDENCRLISYSPLCLGLLTGKYTLDNLPKGNTNPRRQLFRELLPGAQGLLNTLEVIGKDLNKSQSQVAINWALCKDTVPIVGVRTLKQAEENLGAYGWKMDKAMVEELDRAALSVGKPMIQNIFQTK